MTARTANPSGDLRHVGAILAEYIADTLEPTPSLEAVEACLTALAPDLPGWQFGSVLNCLSVEWQPRLHRDADALVAAEGARA